MTDQQPQDAPVTEPVAPAPTVSAPIQPAPLPPPPQVVPKVTYLPPPTGPNWGLVLVGLVFVLVAAGVVANQVSGFKASDLTAFGPTVFVVVGLVCALVGIVGILSRRRR